MALGTLQDLPQELQVTSSALLPQSSKSHDAGFGKASIDGSARGDKEIRRRMRKENGEWVEHSSRSTRDILSVRLIISRK